MFSEKFNELAALVGIDTTQLVAKCDSIEEKYKDSDKNDINIAVEWLKTLSNEITSDELTFLLMASLSPNSSMEGYEEDEDQNIFFEMLKEQGYVQLSDGSWVKPYNSNADKQTVDNSSTEEQKQIGYTSAVEPSRNALGYNHTLSSLMEAVGIDEDMLNRRVKLLFDELPENVAISKTIEAFEREFTRKELSYMHYFSSKTLNELIDKTSDSLDNLIEEITITDQKPKRKTRTPKNKKDNESI